jgi:DNA polymerase
MSLDLDTRQRAMLHEMGVHVWLPQTLDTTSDHAALALEKIAIDQELTRAKGKNGINITATPAPEARKNVPPVERPASSPTAVTALPTGIADMAWPTLATAVEHCQACAMCLGRRAPVLAAPQVSVPCDWLVLSDPPDEMEERAGQPFVDAAGKLLDNMLRAVGVQRLQPQALPELDVAGAAKRAYLTHALKCRPALARAPSADELAICSHYLRREIALTQPKVILAMGRFAMHLLLSETPPEQVKLPLGKLRGQVWRFAGVPVVVTYPPAYLLRSGQDKGKAWADLCLALDVAQGKLPDQI